MPKYSIPQFTVAMNKRGHRLSDQYVRSKLLRLAPPELSQLDNGRYVVETENENDFLNLTYRVSSDTGYWEE